jgi:hypothetical protein
VSRGSPWPGCPSSLSSWRITGEQDPPVVNAPGDIGRRPPAGDPVDPHVEVGTPAPARTSSIIRSTLVSFAALVASGLVRGSPTVSTTRNPDRQSLASRKNPPNTGLLTYTTLSGLPSICGAR